MSKVELMVKEMNNEISKPEIQKALLATTFKNLSVSSMKQAIVEGLMRGFEFKDFLEKNVYAIPFKDGYSLVTSIDYSRKMGMKSGIVGKSSPDFEEKDGKIISCTITVKRKVGEYIGEYTAKVYFDEYYKAGRNGYPSLWDTKPHTMIAKVAEMHALRMACPEELSQQYLEEDMTYPENKTENIYTPEKIEEYKNKLLAVTDEDGLKKMWASFPVQIKAELKSLKDELKAKFSSSEKQEKNDN